MRLKLNVLMKCVIRSAGKMISLKRRIVKKLDEPFLAELIRLGFEHRFEQLYRQYEDGEISLEYFANEIGLNLRDLYAALEQRGLPTSNISR